MNTVAAKYRALADALDVQIQALIRMRDVYRSLANFFDPPAPFPPIVAPPPVGPDPDFDDVPAGDSSAAPEAAP